MFFVVFSENVLWSSQFMRNVNLSWQDIPAISTPSMLLITAGSCHVEMIHTFMWANLEQLSPAVTLLQQNYVKLIYFICWVLSQHTGSLLILILFMTLPKWDCCFVGSKETWDHADPHRCSSSGQTGGRMLHHGFCSVLLCFVSIHTEVVLFLFLII